MQLVLAVNPPLVPEEVSERLENLAENKKEVSNRCSWYSETHSTGAIELRILAFQTVEGLIL
ncbi:Nucleoporin 50 kDa protein [Prunus dulcis]|uniref:Nucleoporin 50 kDa protein n=1 Tax=Prunus dulcis TaxID=3755 RepID=A0A5H2XRX3_PRUDU|nr:Nucleoporin 50 kDa protein [Prunus dulcis]